MSRILKVEDLAEMLGCMPETVREHTPHELPGVKFGRDWVYVESDVIAAVSRLALAVSSRQTPESIMPTPKLRAPRRSKPLPKLGS